MGGPGGLGLPLPLVEKRAMVDAILRCAGLSQWFTQDLEEPPHLSPLPAKETAGGVDGRCLPTQVTGIRIQLHRTRKSEPEILAFYGIAALDELSRTVADQLLTRLQDLSHAPL